MPNSPPMLPPAPLWKASVAVEKMRASNVAALIQLTPPAPQAVIIEEEPFGKNAVVEALYAERPDGDLLSQLVGGLFYIAPLPDADWIRLSQEGLPPVRAGRFFVYGAHDAGEVPPGVIAIRIEAGMAFGTGHHETTTLCLSAMSELAKTRVFSRVLDLGCGTGLLAIAAAKLWQRLVRASDIDPVAVGIARENAVTNKVSPLVRAVVADGLDSPALAKGAPYDLIVANILAGPLTRLAPAISRALGRGGMLILSGLLAWQENLVLSYYRALGLSLRSRKRDGSWSALVLEKQKR